MLTSLYEALRPFLIYVPLSIIGLWRWSYWLIRKAGSKLYRAEYSSWPKGRHKPTVSVVTPVYNEDPELFEEAITSWIKNGVNEIIAVIDKANTSHIADFDRRYVPRKDVRCRLVVTPKPGKRAALCDGIERASGDIIALVDSDTIWGEGVLQKSLPHFLNEQVGGVTVSQRIRNPSSVSDVMFDILLWSRYREEVPYLLGVGKVFNTLSGRTALYRRTALLNPQYDNVHMLRHEHFIGTRGVSGDDKRLTHLILEQGWHLQFTVEPEVFTSGLGTMPKFLKQRLRWTRNSWRADLRAIKSRWVWHHPALAFFLLDRFIQPLIMLIGPLVMALAVAARDWLMVGILISWWLFSRFVKLYGYFKENPQRVIYLPAYIIYTYVNAFIKIYALGTLLEHSWATRWHKSRLKKRFLKKLTPLTTGSVAVVAFIFSLYLFVSNVNRASGASIQVPSAVSSAEFHGSLDFSARAPAFPQLPAGSVLPTGVQSYMVQPGDSLLTLSSKFNMSVRDIKRLNGLRDPDIIQTGQVLLYYSTVGSSPAQ